MHGHFELPAGLPWNFFRRKNKPLACRKMLISPPSALMATLALSVPNQSELSRF
jgi:hypothetical protein